jgi:hypothetical protein
MIIHDGAGTNTTARVNVENRLDVESISRHIDTHINELYSKVFSLPFNSIDPVGADDYFFYMKNTGTKNLHVTDVRIWSTVAGVVEIRAVSGTPSYTSDTDITPVNRNVGSAKTITGTFKTDTDTTGLTNDGILFYMPCDTANEQHHLRTTSHIIVPPGQSIALLWDTSTGVLSGMVSVYEDQGVI